MGWIWNTYKLPTWELLGSGDKTFSAGSHIHVTQKCLRPFLEIRKATGSYWDIMTDFSKTANNLSIFLVIIGMVCFGKSQQCGFVIPNQRWLWNTCEKASLFNCPGRHQLAYFVFFSCISTSICSEILNLGAEELFGTQPIWEWFSYKWNYMYESMCLLNLLTLLLCYWKGLFYAFDIRAMLAEQ